MWMTRVAIANPVFATMVMVALVVLGVFSYNQLQVEQTPDINQPVVFIKVDYPGASPEAVENDINKPIEEAVNTIAGIKQIRSAAGEGWGWTRVELELTTDAAKAVQDVRDRVGQIRATLPKDAKEPMITRAETDNAQPVVTFALVSKQVPMRELTTLADQVVVKQFQRAVGVGRVDVWGGGAREIQVRLRSRDLTAWNVSVDQVMDAVRAANQDTPVGLVQGTNTEAMVRVDGRLKDPRQFADIAVAQRTRADGSPLVVHLAQVADVIDGEAERASFSRVNGEPSLSVQVYKNQDANVVETGEAVKHAAADISKLLPPGVELREIYASSDWIKGSLDGVKDTIVEGALLTVLIVFLFLHSWRSTVITGLTLPIAVIATFIAVRTFGFTLNFMTLMALSLCIGLLIDDAIVVRENIVRYLQRGMSHREAARRGTEEIGLAVMATTFTICAVFIPVAFMRGIIGRFFFPFGVTVAVAVLVSLFVSFTLDPMLSSLWHDDRTRTSSSRIGRLLDGLQRRLDPMLMRVERVIAWAHRVYGRLLAWSLRRRKTVLAIAATAFFGSFAIVPLLGTEFIPETDDGWININLTTAVGSSLERSDAKVQQIEDIVRTFPEVKIINTSIGSGDGRNSAQIQLRLSDRHERARTKKQIENDLRSKLAAIAGIELQFGWDSPIQVNLLGPDPERLDAIVADLKTKFAAVPGATDIQDSLKEGTPAISVHLKDGIASDLGVTNDSIGRALRPLFAGEEVGNWLAPDGQNYKITVQMPRASRTDASDLEALLVPTNRMQSDGTPMLVPLRQVADISLRKSPQMIKRLDLQRRVSITANAQGRPPGDVARDVQAITKTYTLPPGYRFFIDGQSKNMEEAGQAALGALLLAVIFIYIILASQFASFIQPIAIMVSLPLSLIGVFLALLVTHTTLNLFALIGLIMLMGLVTKNAILVVDFANQGRREGKSIEQALLDAGQVRLRPILMTTFAMIFGMMPLALALGDGAELQAGMGRAIIGGVITSTMLTLVVVPVLYAMLEGWWARRRAPQGAVATTVSTDAAAGVVLTAPQRRDDD